MNLDFNNINVDAEDFTIIIKVFGEKDEPCVTVNKISFLDLSVLDPFLSEVKSHRGFYPTGTFRKRGQPTARDLYGKLDGWDMFNALAPDPPSGFMIIEKVEVFREDPLVMEMQ